MTEPDRLCIICLEELPLAAPQHQTAAPSFSDAPATEPPAEAASSGGTTTKNHDAIPAAEAETDPLLNRVACLDGCDHILHDGCIRLWAEKTNTCPICRESFNTIRVFDGINGPAVESYEVEEKKQVAEFDLQQWVADNPEEEEEHTSPCPVCSSSNREDVLLICDACEAAYHTYCIGLNHIPEGNWFCIECDHDAYVAGNEQEGEAGEGIRRQNGARPIARPRRQPPSIPGVSQSRFVVPRTRARLRRLRRQAQSLDWGGPWGQFVNHVYNATHIDLDNHDGDDDALHEFRRSQQQRERDRREFERWQQRLNNERLGERERARDVFMESIPRDAIRQVQREQSSHLPPTAPAQESRDEIRAWGALDSVRAESQQLSSAPTRKRRNPTASPTEANPESQRKLKRPCTRRILPTQNEASSSNSAPQPAPAPVPAAPVPAVAPAPNTNSSRRAENGVATRSPPGMEPPSFLSSLLREVELITPSDDENAKSIFTRSAGDAMSNDAMSPAMSPVTSPSLSAQSPRALSLTPPPLMNGRPSSPPLSSYIEPRYPPANYSPTRATSTSDSDARSDKNIKGQSSSSSSHHHLQQGSTSGLEIRQPRPRRPRRIYPPPRSSPETSPTRPPLSPEAKASINGIVRTALKPHWHAKELTTEQYSVINRDVSRKLYEGIRDPTSLNDEAMKSWEKIASKEVDRAVAETKG